MSEGCIAGVVGTSAAKSTMHPQTHKILQKEAGHELRIKAIDSLTFAVVLSKSRARVRILLCEEVNKDKETGLQFWKGKLKLGPLWASKLI